MKTKTPFFRRFGIEFEFSTPMKEAKKLIRNIFARVYKAKGHNLISNNISYSCDASYKKWELKYDGSTEIELTTPISKLRNFNKINQILALLYNNLCNNRLKLTNNDSAHLHMQANDVPKHNIIAAWIQIEKTILKCFPEHRRDNNYCQKLIHWKRYKKISDFFIDAEIESNAHHAILSLNYYGSRKTVEFRIMEGNVDSHDIQPWVKFCMLFLNYAKKVDPIEIICNEAQPKLTIDEMITLLNIKDKEVIGFLKRREAHFKKITHKQL